MSAVEYGALDSAWKPLLHMWSLSVEEQFYFVFPILLAALYRWIPRFVWVGLMLLFAVSIGFCFNYNGINEQLKFYHPISRSWELLFGALLATFELTPTWACRLLRHRWIGWSGVVLIAAAVGSVSDTDAFPSIWLVAVVVGAGLIICQNANQFGIGRLLSFTPVI